jgi:hypothetical protein
MLDALRSWAEMHNASLAAHGVHVQTSIGGDSPNPGKFLDFDSTQFMGRISCWESGECDLEVVDVGTGKTIYSDHQILTMPRGFTQAFRGFLQILGASI